jgi:hypothetical protein
MLVQNRILTAEPPRTRRTYFLFGGEPFDRLKALSKVETIAKQRPVLVVQSAFLGPFSTGKYLRAVPAGMRFLIQAPSPDWIRKKISLCALCDSAVNPILRKAQIDLKVR